MIRVIVVEDEPLARSRLVRLLQTQAQIEVVGECATGAAAVKVIQKLSPDLVFLDVQMPEMDGFEVLKALDPATLPHVIFVTAYEQYALRAFEVYALDYLLKPFHEARLVKALQRAGKTMEEPQEQTQRRLISLLEELRVKSKYLTRVLLKEKGTARLLNVRDIDWIEADSKYVIFHAGKETHLYRESLARMEELLDPDLFVRTHRSAIVNLDRVLEIRTLQTGDGQIRLKDGAVLPLSRSYRKKIKDLA